MNAQKLYGEIASMPKSLMVNGRARCQFNTLRQIRMGLYHLSEEGATYELIASPPRVGDERRYALHDGTHQLSAYLNRLQFLRWFNDSYAQYIKFP